jgi:hypothetical protein
MRRPTLIALLAALMAMAMALGASAAIAGEATGNNKATSAPDHAKSACSFSGLEDWTLDAPQPTPRTYHVKPGVTQSWGQEEVKPPPGSVFHPGNSCNPNGDPLPHP